VPDELPVSLYAKDGNEGLFVAAVMISELPTLKSGTLLYATRANRTAPVVDPAHLRVY
jgi:hypothetical protein